MDNEIEEIIDVKCSTDSQKSVATSNVYSMDFTDCSSDKNYSSGKETYVIEWDTSEDSEAMFRLQRNRSMTTLISRENKSLVIPKRNINTQYDIANKVSRAASTMSNKCSIIAQEIYTQTSKTIIELAAKDIAEKINTKTLETQTSHISITENKTIEYRIALTRPDQTNNKGDFKIINHIDFTSKINQAFKNSLEDGSSKYPVSETECDKCDRDNKSNSSSDKLINIFNVDSKEIALSEEQNETQYENTSDFEPTNSDIDEDSLIEHRWLKFKSESQSDASDIPKSVDNDIVELYTKLSENIDGCSFEKPHEQENIRLSPLTTLTEETALAESYSDLQKQTKSITHDKDVIFTNNEGLKVKLLPEETVVTQHSFKLPPIRNQSCPSSPHVNFLFSVTHTARPFTKSGTVSSVIEGHREKVTDRWEIGAKDLAAGESTHISGRSDSYPDTNNSVQLPPINIESYKSNNAAQRPNRIDRSTADHNPTPISVKNKIKELKMSSKTRYARQQSESRSGSPNSTASPEAKMCDLAERGCEALCVELLRRLRSTTWHEISDTLEDVPKLLERFWGVITEQRIADLIRQISAHVESPRTQIARAACYTLASVLKNTNYTKKPDFYEAVTILLSKTGSFSRPVRRAANVALDDVVCGVDLTHAVTALCIHGVSHKSGLVRSAAARLLVVCCALGGGGREVLRCRPPTAACARRHTLRSLAALLDDKNSETRKYAERLYSMLRPLANFEAYYLTDVQVDLASKQLKKYDQLLHCGLPKETR